MSARSRASLSLVLAMVVSTAATAPAQDPASIEARAEYLLRRMDRGVMPTPMLIAMLRDPYAETRVLALRVVASSADPSQQMLLWEFVRDRDARVRYEVMVAAGRLGEAGRELAFRGLRDSIPRVRQAAAWAATHGGPEAMEPLVTVMEKEPDVGVRATTLANLWRFAEADWERHAEAAATAADAQLRRAAAYSLARSERPGARPALRRLAGDGEPVIRATAITGLGRVPLTRDDLVVLARAVTDSDARVRAAACGSLARQPAPALIDGAAAAAIEAMWTPVEPQVAVMALRAAGSRPEVGGDARLLDVARREEPWLAAEAFAALVRRHASSLHAAGRTSNGAESSQKGTAGTSRNPDRGDRPAVEAMAAEWMAGDELWRRRAVAAVSPLLGTDWERKAAADAEAVVRLAWLESLDEGGIERRTDELRRRVAGDPDPAVRAVALNHLDAAGTAGGFHELLDLAASWTGDELPDARAAALAAALPLATTDAERESVLELAVGDRDPAVAVLVVDAARSLGLPARSHERELRHNRQWYVDLVDWMRDRHWLDVSTDRGTFRIRLDSIEAPISAREISDLAASGFYDDLTFHRVVPNFVAQGGDPRGDGWGGPGFILPDEPAFSPFDAGRVGIATSGPNTGGSQLFFTLMPADHLVGHYTNLGEVVAGREVLARLRQGDRIRSIEAFSGDEPPPPDPVLLGPVEWSELEVIPGWLEEYLGYEADPAAVRRLAEASGSYRIVTVLGTWCSDSRREVPRLLRVLDEVDAPVFDDEMIGVDRTRRIAEPELAAVAGVERTVERVATIVVFDAEQRELGRIVETAERPIEELLVEFIAPAEGWTE